MYGAVAVAHSRKSNFFTLDPSIAFSDRDLFSPCKGINSFDRAFVRFSSMCFDTSISAATVMR